MPKPTPLSKLKQELEEWKAKYLELEKYCVRESDRYASVLKAKEQDLSFANSAKDTAEMDKWEAVADRDTYAKEIERLNRDLIEARAAAVQAGNERSVLYEELDEQKRETARVLENALGISEERDKYLADAEHLKRLHQESAVKIAFQEREIERQKQARMDSDLIWQSMVDDAKKESQHPPGATWCPADKWFLGIPVLIIGLCFYAIWHSHPNPVVGREIENIPMTSTEEFVPMKDWNECHSYALQKKQEGLQKDQEIKVLKFDRDSCRGDLARIREIEGR